MRFLKCIAQAVVNNGLEALASVIPLGGALVEIAEDAWRRFREPAAKDAAPAEAALSAEIEVLAQAPAAAVRQAVAAAVQETAATQPPEVQAALTSYLTQVPAMIRRSLRRPSDPGGTTVAANRAPRKAEDLLPFLPPKLPRFKPGDRPLPGVNWELEELLGVGGFGEVWKAHHPSLTGITAALKFCLDAEAGKSLRHEAAALNRVMQAGRHAGIVPLRQAYLDNNPICLEYEFVEGGDLGGLIQEMHQRGKVAAVDVARWLLHLAGTVRFAHQMQPPLVHRDLKPANILVQRSSDGRFSLRIADFGISGVAASQALGEAARTPTGRNSLLATVVRGAYTPLYASPQQIKGEPADPRDDIHALGVIWYQMFTGDLSQGLPADWRDELAERGVPGPMSDLLARCVAGRAERRLADAAELVRQLETLLQAGSRPPQPAPVTRPQLDDLADQTDAPSPRRETTPPATRTQPEDLAAQVERTMQNVRRVHAEARQKAEREHDYAAAARLLEGVPEHLRDESLYAAVCDRRDRQAQAAAKQNAERKHADARQKAERERDFAGAARLLEGVPEHLRDGSLYAAVCGWRDQAAALEQEVRAAVQAMRLAGLRPKVEELLQLFPQRADLQRLLATLPKEVREADLQRLLATLPKEVREFANSLGMKFALIPAGKFVMGSPGSEADRSAHEGPQHEVEITRRFYLGIHQVTQEHYEKVMGKNPSRFTKANGGGYNHPVEQVSWEEAVEFCRRLSEKSEEKRSGRVYRLPTEAEWEYTCRGGGTSSKPFHFGDSLCSTQANFNGHYPYGGAEKGPYLERPTAVGSYKANAFGLFDLHGNVWEWCQDWFDKNYYNQSPRQDPQGPQNGSYRVVRGGSWGVNGHVCRAADRYRFETGFRNFFVGFRVLCVAPRTS